MTASTHRATMACWFLLAVSPAAGQAGADGPWRSEDGLYRLGIDSELEPIGINQLHRWVLRLEDSHGQPVPAASIELAGGMPDHNHGLPTQPRVTRELGDGRYLLEGMRFHMPGSWVLRFFVDAGPGSDTVIVRLEL